MKKSLLTIALLTVLKLTAIGQSPFYLSLYMNKDSSSSIFCQVEYSLKIPYLNYLNEEMPGYYPVLIRADSSYLEVKFPFDTSWLQMTTYNNDMRRPGRNPSYVHCLSTGLFVKGYVNTLPLFDEVPGLWESSINGGPLLVRYRFFVGENGAPFHFVYSNIDTIYLPPATDEDVEAFAYLQSHERSVRLFSNLYGYPGLRDSYDYIIEHFPNTMIGEIARYIILCLDMANNIDINCNGCNSDQINQLISQYEEPFKASPSDKILNAVKRQHDGIHE